MKKIISFIGAILIAGLISTSTQAETFVSVKGGTTIAQNESNVFPQATFKGNTNFTGSAEVGYQAGQVGVEAQLISTKADPSIAGYVNATYDVLTGSVKPYAIAGVGSNLKSVGAADSVEYQAGAGVKVKVSKTVDIDGRVTYQGKRGVSDNLLPLIGLTVSL